MLRHSETDEISSGCREVGQLLQWQEEAEYTSANARLMEEIQLLADREQFNLKKLLGPAAGKSAPGTCRSRGAVTSRHTL